MSQQTISTQGTKVLYTAQAHTTGGREGGASRTSDGRLDIQFTLPGSAGKGTNPEQLLSVGWSACFISAIRIATGKMKIAFPADTAIDAEVDLCTGSDGYFLQARLNVSLPGIEREVAQAVVEAAEKLCPYSKGLKGNVNVEIHLV
jgi:osmotically inducible protein OsmC